MTDERTLYETDRTGWLAYVAPNMARQIATDPDDKVNRDWPRIPEDYKAAVWALLPEAQKQRIRMLRRGK
jgi:hypothetical protein